MSILNKYTKWVDSKWNKIFIYYNWNNIVSAWECLPEHHDTNIQNLIVTLRDLSDYHWNKSLVSESFGMRH